MKRSAPPSMSRYKGEGCNQRQLPIAPSLPQPLHWSHTSFPRTPPSFQRRLESSVRDSGAHTGRRGGRVVCEVPVPRRSPRPLGEGEGEGCNQRQLPIAPSLPQPLHWSHTSFPRTPPSFQRRLESSVRDSGAHTGRRGGRVVSEVPVFAEASEDEGSEKGKCN